MEWGGQAATFHIAIGVGAPYAGDMVLSPPALGVVCSSASHRPSGHTENRVCRPGPSPGAPGFAVVYHSRANGQTAADEGALDVSAAPSEGSIVVSNHGMTATRISETSRARLRL